MNAINWNVEHEKFLTLAFPDAHKAALRTFWHWRHDKRDDAIQECLSKMWDSWSRARLRGKNPEKMIGSLIKFALLWVRYDRKLGGRARTPDVYDYRSGFKQQLLGDDESACPSDRADSANGWINWDVQTGDNPADLAAALETCNITLSQWCDL